jgi:small GTP-binding protein
MKLKLLMLGDSGVGKTCLLTRWSDDKFLSTYITTLGMDTRSRDFTFDGEKVHVSVWDTAGQEKFRSITSSYLRGSTGICLCVDPTHRPSIENVAGWLRSIKDVREGVFTNMRRCVV